MPMLNTLLNAVRPGTPIVSRNARLTPLLPREQPGTPREYLLAAEAFEQGVLKVTEVTEQGSVPELFAVSEADVAILILDGEELVGAKQNRILNTDVLLRPRGKTKIPVSCVEQGRWRHVRPDFVAGSHAPPAVRGRKSSSVSRNMRETGVARSDQAEVWDEVACFLQATGSSSDTAAMADAFKQRQDDLDVMVRELSCPQDAVGVLVTINGQFTCLDLLGHPTALQQVWPRLVAGYAADALTHTAVTGPVAESIDPATILDRLGQIDCVACPGVDLGDDWRFEAADLHGSALVRNESAVHLSAFPSAPHENRGSSGTGRIASPSRRQRRQPPPPPAY